MDCLFSWGSAVGSHGKGFSVLPGMATTKPNPNLEPTMADKQRTLPEGPAEAHPFSPSPRLDPALGPRLCSQLFCSSQWCLGVQEPENQMARAFLQVWTSRNQLQLSLPSDCAPPPLDLPSGRVRYAQSTSYVLFSQTNGQTLWQSSPGTHNPIPV